MSEPTPTAMQRAAFECSTLAQAAAQLGLEKLPVVLQDQPALKDGLATRSALAEG